MSHNYNEIIARSEFHQLNRKNEKKLQNADKVNEYLDLIKRERGIDEDIKAKEKRVNNTLKKWLAKRKKEKENDTARN